MNDLLLEAAGRWWAWSAQASLQAAALFAVVAALDRLLRRRTWPQLLAALWFMVLLKAAVPAALVPPLNLTLPGIEGSVLAAPEGAGLTPQTHLVLFALWALGTGTVLLAFAWRSHGLRRRWLGTPPERTPSWLAAMAREVAARLGLRRVPRLRVQLEAPGPAVAGFLRPVIVLPVGLVRRGRREDVRHVLLHECAHVRRRDPLLALFLVAVQAACWFHPFVWLARRRLETLVEASCDRLAVAALGPAAAGYRRTLLALARPLLAPPASGILAFLRRRSQLLARLRWLEGASGVPSRARRAATALLCGLVLASGVTPAGPRTEGALFDPARGPFPGCFQLRFTVLALLAEEGRRAETDSFTTPPRQEIQP